MHNHNENRYRIVVPFMRRRGERGRTQFDSLPLGLRDSAGVEGKEKSTGEGGGAGVSPISWVEREAVVLVDLKAALTSWPRVELVRMERRWRWLEPV